MKAQKSRDVRKAIAARGWVFLRNAPGSHEIWGLPNGSVKHSIPFGHREISAGVLDDLGKKVELPKEWR